jgi:hypothetical protein
MILIRVINIYSESSGPEMLLLLLKAPTNN